MNVEKSDFVLAPYMKSDDLRAAYQILNTVVPYVLLWILAAQTGFSLLLLPILILLILFSVRCFSLMHDCGHYSLFNSRRVNRSVGFVLGLINAVPQYSWSRDHAYHHKTNGDWERYRGVADFLSTEEFSRLSAFDQKLYELLRQPLMAIPGGFFHLVIKPRLALIVGIYALIWHLTRCVTENLTVDWVQAFSTHKSRHWHSSAEFWDLLFNNIGVVTGWVTLSYWLGFKFFLIVYSVTITCAAVIFIWVFFVQHVFEGAYAHKTEGWNYVQGAIVGSSYLELPAVLKWFIADISYHNIHHLSERIPNYYLAACHQANSHLLASIKTLRMRDMPVCSKYILWDSDANRLISVEAFRKTIVTAHREVL
jgi:acyl-lipid omega-6 desaturase (Delta-12 desaturase)